MKQYELRLENVRQKMHELQIESLLVEDKINLYYCTGINLTSGSLLITADNANLIVDGRYIELCQKLSPFPAVLSKGDILKELVSERKLAFDAETTTYHRYEQLKEKISSIMPVNNPIKKIRSIKDTYEIDILRKSSALAVAGFEYSSALLQEGITEDEVARQLEIFWREYGGDEAAFPPIIAFGPNGSMPHYSTGKSVLEKGQAVLLDIGVSFQHYMSDMSRVVFYGEPNPKIKEIYEIVKTAQQRAIELCKPGTLIGQLDEAARSYIEKKGYGEYFPHSLGHGVGLEVHEYPVIRNKPPYADIPLEAGMVLTIEPGIYLPSIGGVRLEETILITANGHEVLTKDNPR